MAHKKITIKENIFCKLDSLNSEADVEALIVERLLAKLHYPDDCVHRKASLKTFAVGKGSKKENYKPDYVLFGKNNVPRVVIDAKSTEEAPQNFHYQVSGYALALNQQHKKDNPVKYTLLTNGLKTIVYHWDEDVPILELAFSDFHEDNSKFIQLRSLLSYGALEVTEATEDVFEFTRPSLDSLIKTFDRCHDLIWKKEKLSPTVAFYEFAKIMFIKMREDQRIARMIAEGKKPKPSDFCFSVHWITEQIEKEIDDNPLANILFHRVHTALEEQVKSGKKKRIFQKDETLTLKSATCLEVVRLMQHFDLHGIDEDLNGRMFETFLNATVRGKELGQFFTPRSVVKYMTHSAELKVTGNDIPMVFDGCCGSAGFLIEAMAVLVHNIDNKTNLTDKQKKDLKERLYTSYLWGSEANDTITRIARLNMYLHGDGGSKIFTSDTLDKTLSPEDGLSKERTDELDEFRKHLLEDDVRFDVILTNPPFSMSYKKKDEHEAKVLEQYDIAKKKGKVATSAKSNILFIERYFGLLNVDGQLLTVIDDTVLNGIESQGYRDYILDNFIIKQIVSLPFNTFRRAEAGVKTSIVHVKRKETGETQGDVFMAIVNNVGHDDHKRSTPDRDNLTLLKKYYSEWMEYGEIKEHIDHCNLQDEGLGCPFQIFTVKAKDLKKNRLDAFYYSPELRDIRKTLRKKEKAGLLEVRSGKDYKIIKYMGAGEVSKLSGKEFKYIDISAVTQTGAIASYAEGTTDDLPGRARLKMKTNDVLFAKLITSRGINFIVPKEFNGELGTNGFIGIRTEEYEEALLLWSILKTDIATKQLYYLAVTALQPELKEEIFKEEFLIPIPTKKSDRDKLINNAKQIMDLHETERSIIDNTKRLAETLFQS